MKVEHDLRISLLLEQSSQSGNEKEQDNSDNIVTFYLGRLDLVEEEEEKSGIKHVTMKEDITDVMSQTVNALLDDTGIEDDGEEIRGIRRESSFKKKWREKAKLDREQFGFGRNGNENDDQGTTNKRNPFNGDNEAEKRHINLQFLRDNYSSYPSLIDNKTRLLEQSVMRDRHQVAHFCRLTGVLFLIVLLLWWIPLVHDTHAEYYLTDTFTKSLSEDFTDITDAGSF